MIIEVAEIGQISELVTSGSRGWAAYYADSGALFLRMTNLPKDGIKLLLDDKKYVQLPEGSNEGKRTAVRDGDILISITAELGKIGFVEGFANKEAYVNQHICLIRPTPSEVNPKFLAYYLSSPSQRYLLNSLNDSGAKSGLNLSAIAKFRINLPDINLQEHAVYFLEYWESAIEKTEALIEAKERQFRWLIHNMIGRYQFAGEWSSFTLEDIFKVSVHKSKSISICENGKYYIVDMGSISRHGELIAAKKSNIAADMLEAGELVMPKDDIGGGNIIGKVAVVDKHDKYVCGDHVYRLRAKCTVNPMFIKYVINSTPINKMLRTKANGTSQLGLGKKDVLSQVVRLPGISTQHHIANTLDTAKQEIDLLRKLVDEYLTQKRGLMQRLLIGS